MNSYRRRLPHFHAIGEPLFVTCRLHGSLPPGREFPNETMTQGKAFVRMDRLLEENRSSPAFLAIPAIARMTADAIQSGDGGSYDLHAWVMMPNHLHLLITPRVPVPEVMQKLKGRVAREANKLLHLTGQPFWQRESFDRLVRDGEEFRRIVSYIAHNPVRAGLARTAEEYPWCSAGRLKPAAG